MRTSKKIVNTVYTICYTWITVQADIANPLFVVISLMFFAVWLGGLTLIDHVTK